MQKDLVIVGSVALDTIETPFGSVEEELGGSATFSSCSASRFSSVHLVAVVGDDFPDEHREFLGKYADLEGLMQTEGQTFRWKGEYGKDLENAKTLDTRLGVFGSFEPVLPNGCRSAAFAFLANIDPEIQLSVLDQLEKPVLTAADTMNFWIEGKSSELEKVISKVDLFLINEGEAVLLTGKSNHVKAGNELLKMGPKAVVVKMGAHGAMLFTSGGLFSIPAFPLESLMDPTGAGDSFAGGLMGTMAGFGTTKPDDMRRAAVNGAVMASFAVESMGTKALAAAQKQDINSRVSKIRDMTSFSL